MRGVFRAGVCVAASVLALAIGLGARAETTTGGVTEAPAAFDNVSNGFAEEFCANQAALAEITPDSPAIDADECSFDTSAEEFLGPEHVSDGLGPVFNATGCGECHSAPVLGGTTQVAERRAGIFNGFQFIDHPGGSLLHDRATDPSLQEYMMPGKANVFTFRASQSVLGDGYVEAIANSTLSAIAAGQPLSMRGQLIQVPVFEKPGMTRTGRFGWKAQQASLLSFSADAYVNEMGITSPLQPIEPTSNGNPVTEHDNVPLGHPNDPDDDGVDVALFAVFMRSTKAPPRDETRAATPDAIAGSGLFNQIGCGVCHVRNIVTAEPGTPLNGGALKVAAALGNKRIHPFGDYLLHDVGTGDGIVQNGGMSTRNKVRTPPLWGLRARGRFMHDFMSNSVEDAIQRHDNQAQAARRGFNGLTRSEQRKLLAFLSSL